MCSLLSVPGRSAVEYSDQLTSGVDSNLSSSFKSFENKIVGQYNQLIFNQLIYDTVGKDYVLEKVKKGNMTSHI